LTSAARQLKVGGGGIALMPKSRRWRRSLKVGSGGKARPAQGSASKHYTDDSDHRDLCK